MKEHSVEAMNIEAAKSRSLSGGGYLLSGSLVRIGLPFLPDRYLQHGWQSWSLASWVPTAHPLPTMRPSILHAEQTDPAYARKRNPNGAWYGAVKAPGGELVFLGSLDLEARVELDGRELMGRYEAGSGEWFCAAGDQAEVQARYAGLLAERFGKTPIQSPPRVWCSWYSLYTEIDEARLVRILSDLGDLPFEVFQIDDGWQQAIGSWQANEKFPAGMDGLASRIKATRRKAGLWLAPLLVVPSAPLYQQHPDWLLRDSRGGLVPAGFNWGEPCYALDTTHPEVLEWLAALMKTVRAWGYDYAKLDFLYAGALPGKRHVDMPREAAYRKGLQVIREALGDAYLLTCGAPILPSLGLCDGMRIGPDVAPYWISFRDNQLLMNFATPGGQNALRTSLNRLWLKPLVNTDPDVVYFRTKQNQLTSAQKELLQDLAQIAEFKAASDPPSWLTETEQLDLRRFLEAHPKIERVGPSAYRLDGRLVDFEAFIPLPRFSILHHLLGWVVGGLGNVPQILRILDRAGKKSLQKTLSQNP